jgi:hypothetical protein
MGSAFAFLGTFLLSLFVALLAALQLADHFRATEEFVLVLIAIPALTFVILLCFAVTYAAARKARAFGIVAVVLALLMIALVTLPAFVEWRAGRSLRAAAFDRNNLKLALELLVPLLLAILVQWGLLRRRWLRARGAEDLSRWPWVATTIGGLVVLNPVGLDFVHSALPALRRPPNEWSQHVPAMAAAGAALALLVMAWIEYYIRSRMLRGRLAVGPAAG